MFWLMLLLSITIAAFIGGITNHLAIKMLFFPYEEKRWFGVRVPFTPGIIPKRRDEIAASFGSIVSAHLITADGIRRWLREPQFAGFIQDAIERYKSELLARDETLAELLARFLSPEKITDLQERTAAWVQHKVPAMALGWWRNSGLGQRPIKEMLGEWTEAKRGQLSEKASGMLLAELERLLLSEKGDQFLEGIVSKLVAKLTEGIGGGMLVKGFVDGYLRLNPLTPKLKEEMLRMMRDPLNRERVVNWLDGKLSEWENRPLDELLTLVSERDSGEWLASALISRIDWRQPVEQLFQLRASALLGDGGMFGQEVLAPKRIAEFLLGLLEKNVQSILASLQLAKLVEHQVSQFPIEQIERMILDVSGREFRAITWLGALLGGLIGLVQFLILHLLN